MEYTHIASPIDGRISRKLTTVGNLVNGNQGQSTLLTTIVSMDPVYCYFDADERAVLKYQQLARDGQRCGFSRRQGAVRSGTGQRKRFSAQGRAGLRGKSRRSRHRHVARSRHVCESRARPCIAAGILCRAYARSRQREALGVADSRCRGRIRPGPEICLRGEWQGTRWNTKGSMLGPVYDGLARRPLGMQVGRLDHRQRFDERPSRRNREPRSAPRSGPPPPRNRSGPERFAKQ